MKGERARGNGGGGTYLVRNGSLGEKLGRGGSDTSSETLEDLGDDKETGRAMGAARLDHESDTEETDEKTSGEEPLGAPEVELEESGANSTEGESEGLGVGEVSLIDNGPVLDDRDERVLVGVLEVERDEVEETDYEKGGRTGRDSQSVTLRA
jgi:hypothetical protein